MRSGPSADWSRGGTSMAERLKLGDLLVEFRQALLLVEDGHHDG